MYRQTIDIAYAYKLALKDHLALYRLYKKYGMPNLARHNKTKAKEFIQRLRIVRANRKANRAA